MNSLHLRKSDRPLIEQSRLLRLLLVGGASTAIEPSRVRGRSGRRAAEAVLPGSPELELLRRKG